MTLKELNKIEQVLKENKDKKEKAKSFFKDTMREKYCEDGSCWFRGTLNLSEQEIYDKLVNEADEALDIYKSFVEHDWK